MKVVSTHFFTKSFLHCARLGCPSCALTHRILPVRVRAHVHMCVLGGMGLAILPTLQMRKERLRDRLDQDYNGWAREGGALEAGKE